MNRKTPYMVFPYQKSTYPMKISFFNFHLKGSFKTPTNFVLVILFSKGAKENLRNFCMQPLNKRFRLVGYPDFICPAGVRTYTAIMGYCTEKLFDFLPSKKTCCRLVIETWLLAIPQLAV